MVIGYTKQGLLQKPVKFYLQGAPLNALYVILKDIDVLAFEELFDIPPPLIDKVDHIFRAVKALKYGEDATTMGTALSTPFGGIQLIANGGPEQVASLRRIR
jgi:hypothetical protein